jgi:hypothetical protein
VTIELQGKRRIDWARPSGCPSGFETKYVVLGNDDGGGIAIEVAIAEHAGQLRIPSRPLRDLHRIRLGNRAIPLVLGIETSEGVYVYGPNPDAAPTGPMLAEQAERFLQSVLDELSPVLARARLAALNQGLDSTAMPGVKNSGLFANHELRVGVPARADWQAACERSAALLASKGPQLIEKLGFKVGRAGAHAMVLSGKGPHPQAIAVMLDEREAFDAESQRFAVSPVAYGLRMAEQQGVPWLIMLRGTQLRLYPARIEFGVGRKGLAETFFEVDLPQLTRDNAGYVDLIFSATALEENGTAYEILKSSAQYAVELGERLRDKVYEEIIPDLSLAIADALIERDHEMDADGLDLAYQLTLRVFFRMLFQVYAEDRKLLPYGENTKYDRNAIKTMAKDFVENPEQEFDEESTSLWDDLAQVWRVIDSGDRAWGVPAYNGGLFASDKEINEHGHILKDIHLSNAVMGPVLKALLLDEADDGEIGQIDFRSLSVREFGTIYEGLLESSLGLAEVDLTLDDKGTWIPAKKKDEVYAYAGQVYFHNTSGQRKGTGSYFTPSFVVEHLLERSLDPALDAHLEKVKALIVKQDHAGAGELFFDFRVADLAMGSGHFLTSAIDHIEQRMAAFLAEDGNVIPGVTAELQKLEQAAIDALGPDALEPERSSLLRRQIARRCIYGLDINPIAVELARVSIWIHTFVRGLPMSSLDHNLVCANSLTGIGSIDEVLDIVVAGRRGNHASFYDADFTDILEKSKQTLIDAALLAEATKDEARKATRAAKRALKEAEEARLICDAAILIRTSLGMELAGFSPTDLAEMASAHERQELLSSLRPAHLPVLFPEVFSRSNPGFDVLVGNPPWEKLKVEEHQWWASRFPGLRSMPMATRSKKISELRKARLDLAAQFENDVEVSSHARAVIASGAFPGLGKGDIDLYQAFAWRNWSSCREGGAIGLVLPRNALSGSGTEVWRREVMELGEFSNVVFLTNTRGWVFPSVHPQYTVALVGISKRRDDHHISTAGTFYSMSDFLSRRDMLADIAVDDLQRWSSSVSFPLIPDAVAGNIFKKMKEQATLTTARNFEFRRTREIESTHKDYFSTNLDVPKGGIEVLTGASFNLWAPKFGKPYAYASEDVNSFVLSKIVNSSKNSRSAYHGLGITKLEDLPIHKCRIFVRDVCRPNDTRTVIPCLMPPGVTGIEKAPYLLRKKGDERHEAYVLGVLSSMPFDWMARRVVELALTQEVLHSLPIPDVAVEERYAARIAEIAATLATVDNRYLDWARVVGVDEVSPVPASEEMLAELDALVCILFELDVPEVEYIYRTFHHGADYSVRCNLVLEKMKQLEA